MPGRRSSPFRARSTAAIAFSMRRTGRAASRGDALLYRARFMNVLLGVVLGVLVYCWVAEWLGFRAAVVALGLYTIEPNIAAHCIARHDRPGRRVLHVRRDLLPLANVETADAVEHRRARRLLRARDAEQVLGRDSRSGCARPPGDDRLAPPDVVGARGCWHRRAARGRHVAWRLGGLWLSIRAEHDSWLGVRAPRSARPCSAPCRRSPPSLVGSTRITSCRMPSVRGSCTARVSCRGGRLSWPAATATSGGGTTSRSPS